MSAEPAISASATFWPWWLGGLAIATSSLTYPLLTARTLGVSSLFQKLVEQRRAKPEQTTVTSLDELERALLAATEEEFGAVEDEAQEAPSPSSEVQDEVQDELQDELRDAMTDDSGARIWFLAGLILAPFLIQLARGHLADPSSLGHRFDERFVGLGGWVVVLLFACGILIGFGTRMAGGCTSGHGITGVASGERGALVSTVTFWSVGMGTAWLLTWVAL